MTETLAGIAGVPLPRRGSGRALEPSTRAFMERGFGHDFGGVRVHTGPEAARANRELEAIAFTTGHDIFFDDGRYRPDSAEGRWLLAHELTHVVQQRRGTVAASDSGSRLSKPGDPSEREADAAAHAVVHGHTPAISPAGQGEVPVQRFGLPSLSDIGDALSDAGGALVDAGGAVVDTVGEGLSAAGNFIAGIAIEVWDLANSLASAIGGLVHVSGTTLVIDVPSVSLCGSGLDLDIPVPEIDLEIPLWFGAWPLNRHLLLLGYLSLRTRLAVNAGLRLGPCDFNGLRIVIDPLAARVTASGSLSVSAGGSVGAGLNLGGHGEVDILLHTPSSLVPFVIPAATIDVGIAGGMFGTIDGTLTLAEHISAGLFSGISLSAAEDLDLALAWGATLVGYGHVEALGITLCSILWPLVDVRRRLALSMGLGLHISTSGVSLSTPTASLALGLHGAFGFTDLPSRLMREGIQVDCPLLDRICMLLYKMGLMPSQRGGSWTGHPTPPWPSPAGSTPPPEIYARNPGIPSKAQCRGACGPDCDTCTNEGDHFECHPQPDGGHRLVRYPNYTVCGSHQGCRDHDACYDWCGSGGPSGLGPMLCRRLCDFECLCNYPARQCIGWVFGRRPFDQTMYFSDKPSLVGACYGRCPDVTTDDKGKLKPIKHCLDPIVLWAGLPLPTRRYSHSTGWINVFQKNLLVFEVVHLHLRADVAGRLGLTLGAHLGPVTLREVCLILDPTTGTYSGGGKLNVVANFNLAANATGTLRAECLTFCLLSVFRGEGDMSATGRFHGSVHATAAAALTCRNGELILDADAWVGANAKIELGLQAAIRAFLLGFQVFSHRWTLLERVIPIADWKMKLGSFSGRVPVGAAPPTMPDVRALFADVIPAASAARDALAEIFRLATGLEPPSGEDDGIIARIIRFVTSFCGPGNDPPPLPPGSDDEPWDIDYPKRACENYTDLFFGPRSAARRVTQRSLCQAFDETPKPDATTPPASLPPAFRAVFDQLAAADQTRWQNDGYPVERIEPTGSRTLPGQRIAVGVDPVHQTQQGMVWVMVESNRTAGGGKILSALRPFGFRASNEDLDGDHVIERQMGGPDERGNLWMLDSTENSRAGGTLDRATARRGTTTKPFRQLKQEASPANPISLHLATLLNVAKPTGCGHFQAKSVTDTPGSPLEHEADRAAEHVVSGAGPAPSLSHATAGGLASGVHRSRLTPASFAPPRHPPGRSAAQPHPDDPVTALLRTPGAGVPLPPGHRTRLEHRLHSDLRGVRLHTGPDAAEACRSIHARAFTSGSHIWFGRGESPADLRLLAHEVAHVLQQGAAPRLEHGPTGASPPQTVHPDPATQRVQRWSWRDITPDFIEAGVDLIGEAVGSAADLAWGVVRRFAPGLARIIEEVRSRGILGYLGDLIRGGLRGLFDGLHDQGGVLGGLADVFAGLAASAADILSNLAAGNCQPVFAAVERLKNTVATLAGDAWNAITDFFRPVGDFFGGLWRAFDQSVLAWLRQVGSDAWQGIQELGSTIWGYVEPVKNAIASIGGQVWDWVKDQLGIRGGSDGDSQGGLLAWVQEKASAAWTAIREQLQPVIRPIQGLIERVREILPLDAILHLRQTVQDWLTRVTQTANALDSEDGATENQANLRQQILPAVLATIGRMHDGVLGAGQWVSGRIQAITQSVTGFLAGVAASPLLGFAARAIGWLGDRVAGISGTITGVVQRVFGFVARGLQLLQRFLEPILNVLLELVSLVGDLLGRLVSFITGALWGWIPACIRRPIQDFLLNQILRRIPLFSQLLELPDLWARIQSTALRILRQVFVDGNLAGAAWTFFRALLEFFGLPGRLVLGIVAKAARAIGDIISHPVDFFINLLRAVKGGFERFFGNIGTNLLTGFANWLFGALGDLNIAPPRDFSLQSILGLVLQILGISVDRIFQKIERRIGPEMTGRLRQTFQIATGVWRFVSILVEQGPAGLWHELMERLSDLWSTVRDAAVNWIVERVISEATQWLLSLLDITGIMPVVRSLIAVYRAIESAIQYLRRMLEIVERVLDGILQIAQGATDSAAHFLEDALVRSLPVAIGFLANQLGLGSLPRRLAEIIGGVRQRVDAALDWLVDRAVRTGQAILDGLRSGARAAVEAGRQAVAAVFDWWHARETRTLADGHPHSIFVSGDAEHPTVRVASDEMDVDSAVQRIADPAAKARAVAKRDEITEILRRLHDDQHVENVGNRPAADGTQRTDRIRTLTTELREKFVALMDIFNDELFSGVTWSELPATSTPAFQTAAGKAGRMSIDQLTAKRPDDGSEPEVDVRGWNFIQAAGLSDNANWVRLHLLNHRFRGSGANPANLVPGTRRNNSNHLAQMETPIKHLVGDVPGDHASRGVVWYEAEVTYSPNARGAGEWPASLLADPALSGKLRASDYAEFIDLRFGLWQATRSSRAGLRWTKDGQPTGSLRLEVPLPPFRAAHRARLATAATA